MTNQIRITPAGATLTTTDIRGKKSISSWASQVGDGVTLQIAGRDGECATIRIPREQIPELEALIEKAKHDDLSITFGGA